MLLLCTALLCFGFVKCGGEEAGSNDFVSLLQLGVHVQRVEEGRLRVPELPTGHSRNEEDTFLGQPMVSILTVPNRPSNQQRFEYCSDVIRELGYEFSPIDGINFQSVYPSDVEVASNGWDLTRTIVEKQKAIREIFQKFRKSAQPKFDFPVDFEDDAIHNLSPGQVAVYLGHWGFWEKAAQQPEGYLSVIVEDDAELYASPQLLNHAFEASCDSTDAVLLNLDCEDNFRMASTLGYAVTPETARRLMRLADGKIPVDWSINALSSAGAFSGCCYYNPLAGFGFGATNSTKGL